MVASSVMLSSYGTRSVSHETLALTLNSLPLPLCPRSQCSHGCFSPSNAGPSCFALYINCSREVLAHDLLTAPAPRRNVISSCKVYRCLPPALTVHLMSCVSVAGDTSNVLDSTYEEPHASTNSGCAKPVQKWLLVYLSDWVVGVCAFRFPQGLAVRGTAC